MANIQFTSALQRFFPGLKPQQIEGKTLSDVLEKLEEEYPGLRSYLVDDQGELRQHVNIFINNSLLKDRKTLSDQISNQDSIFIMQALSGG